MRARDVVFVDGVRTPFGKAKGQYAETRADDLVIKCIRELLRRNPGLPPERVDEVAIAATTQIGDQGLTIGRTAALLAGLPQSVPGYAIDRMCAGAMTAVTTAAGSIAYPGTVTGRPARIAALRPIVSPWSPICVVAAIATSPILSSGNAGLRRSSSLMTRTTRSSALVSA